MGHIVKSWMTKKEDTITDIKKTETDFIMYTKDNLIWFSYNLVGCVMPIIVLCIVNSQRTVLDGEECPSYVTSCAPLTSDEKMLTYVILGQSIG